MDPVRPGESFPGPDRTIATFCGPRATTFQSAKQLPDPLLALEMSVKWLIGILITVSEFPLGGIPLGGGSARLRILRRPGTPHASGVLAKLFGHVRQEFAVHGSLGGRFADRCLDNLLPPGLVFANLGNPLRFYLVYLPDGQWCDCRVVFSHLKSRRGDPKPQSQFSGMSAGRSNGQVFSSFCPPTHEEEYPVTRHFYDRDRPATRDSLRLISIAFFTRGSS